MLWRNRCHHLTGWSHYSMLDSFRSQLNIFALCRERSPLERPEGSPSPTTNTNLIGIWVYALAPSKTCPTSVNEWSDNIVSIPVVVCGIAIPRLREYEISSCAHKLSMGKTYINREAQNWTNMWLRSFSVNVAFRHSLSPLRERNTITIESFVSYQSTAPVYIPADRCSHTYRCFNTCLHLTSHQMC